MVASRSVDRPRPPRPRTSGRPRAWRPPGAASPWRRAAGSRGRGGRGRCVLGRRRTASASRSSSPAAVERQGGVVGEADQQLAVVDVARAARRRVGRATRSAALASWVCSGHHGRDGVADRDVDGDAMSSSRSTGRAHQQVSTRPGLCLGVGGRRPAPGPPSGPALTTAVGPRPARRPWAAICSRRASHSTGGCSVSVSARGGLEPLPAALADAVGAGVLDHHARRRSPGPRRAARRRR